MNTLICFASSKVPAGFPSPADDYIESRIDLNKVLIRHPASTTLRTMPNNSLVSYGIYQGDFLIVDKSILAKQNSLIISMVDGSEVIGWLHYQNRQTTITNDDRVYQLSELTVQGTITWSIRHL